MKFSKVVFVNYFHNGDLHVSRGLVRAVMNKFPNLEYAYSHTCPRGVLKDIPNLGFVPKAKLPKVIVGSDLMSGTLYLNTWYGAYNQKHNGSTGIAFDALYGVFDNHLKDHFDIRLHDIETDPSKLFPIIDFSKFKTEHIKTSMEEYKSKYKKIILISNGTSLSGQAVNFPFAPVINALATMYQNYLFIYTNNDNNIKKLNNIKLSTEIIGKVPCDLNENAYLSTFCNVIIGRTSGVYTFAMIQDNMFDSNKTMISFSNIGKDDGNYWLSHKFIGKIKYKAKVMNFKIYKVDMIQKILKGIL